jgi:hypothetical protein
MAVDAVVRILEVIGEAARHVDETTAQRYPDVPWRETRDPRNPRAHEYFGAAPNLGEGRQRPASCARAAAGRRRTLNDLRPLGRNHMKPTTLNEMLRAVSK